MNKEEKALSDAYDRSELATEKPTKAFMHMLALAGGNTFRKDKRINIRPAITISPESNAKPPKKESPNRPLSPA